MRAPLALTMVCRLPSTDCRMHRRQGASDIDDDRSTNRVRHLHPRPAAHRPPHSQGQPRGRVRRDPQLHALIASIQQEELAHLREAENNQRALGLARALLLPLIGRLTDLMIWLSTWGDSSRMRTEMARAGKSSRG